MSMLSLIVFLPLAAAAVLAAVPAIGPAAARWAWIAMLRLMRSPLSLN